jgi:hypothetical protein
LGIIFLIAFTKYQSRIDSPVFNIKLFFENKVFRLSTLSALINYSATFAIAFMFSLYLQYVRGLDPKEAGLVLIVQSIIPMKPATKKMLGHPKCDVRMPPIKGPAASDM